MWAHFLDWQIRRVFWTTGTESTDAGCHHGIRINPGHAESWPWKNQMIESANAKMVQGCSTFRTITALVLLKKKTMEKTHRHFFEHGMQYQDVCLCLSVGTPDCFLNMLSSLVFFCHHPCNLDFNWFFVTVPHMDDHIMLRVYTQPLRILNLSIPNKKLKSV